MIIIIILIARPAFLEYMPEYFPNCFKCINSFKSPNSIP